jgi:hypothetical protein
MTIEVTLEHEHFDAFGREGGGPTSSPRMLWTDHRVCAGASTGSTNVARGNVLPPLGMTVRGIWTRKVNGSGNEHDSGRSPYASYVWAIRHDDPVGSQMEMDKQTFERCKNNHTNVLLGESHMRFMWSWVAYTYFDAQSKYLNTLERKHNDVSFYHLNLTQKYFVQPIVRYLNKLHCQTATSATSNDSVTITLQTGSWDLANMPLRAVFNNPLEVPSLIDAIRRMQERGCSAHISLVIVHTMPFPRCHVNDTSCRGSQGWRNNYAVAALNHHLTSQLFPAGGVPIYDKMKLIDSLDLISPNRKHSVCTNHFLCRHMERQKYRLERTPPGVALSRAVVEAMCT